MRQRVIVFFIYDNNIYLKIDDEIASVPLDANVVMNGRINSVRRLISNLKKCKKVLHSFFKLVNDSYVMIYFSNYNNYEIINLENDFKENGIEKIKLINYQKILKLKSNEVFIIANNTYYYVASPDKCLVLPELDSCSKYTNSKIIADKKCYNFICSILPKRAVYMIDDLPKYLINMIC